MSWIQTQRIYKRKSNRASWHKSYDITQAHIQFKHIIDTQTSRAKIMASVTNQTHENEMIENVVVRIEMQEEKEKHTTTMKLNSNIWGFTLP